MPIPIPVELDRCTPPVAGGLLSGACPLPDGWQRGVSFQDTSCLTPTVMGECPTCPNELKATQTTADTVTFRPVSLISAVRCSTFGGIDVRQVASTTIDETAGFALSREMLTGQAAFRDANPNNDEPGNPALTCDSTVVGEFDTPSAALSCLERSLAEVTGGRSGYLLAAPEILQAMAMSDVVYREGGRWYTLTGNRVISDFGFDGRPPVCDDSPGCEPWGMNGGPAVGEPLWLYATASVWAGVGTDLMRDDVNRANNTANARAERVAMAAFTPCATFAASTGVVKTC